MSKSVIITIKNFIVIIFIYNNNKHYYNITVQKTKQKPPQPNKQTN